MYTVHQAKTNLSKLLRKAARGEEVIIARGKTPVAKLVAVLHEKKKQVPGPWKGKIAYTSDAFAPLTKKELAEWGIEGSRFYWTLTLWYDGWKRRKISRARLQRLSKIQKRSYSFPLFQAGNWRSKHKL